MIEGQPYMDEAVVREGGELLHKGRDLWTHCFHGERTPSFKISTDRVHGHCFGCGWHGDSIDYVRTLRGLSFKDALDYLGIRRGNLTPAERRAAEKARREREHKRELVAKFRVWEQEAVNSIAPALRSYRHLRASRKTYTEAELQSLAMVQGEVDALECHYNILSGRDDHAKLALYKEMTLGRHSI